MLDTDDLVYDVNQQVCHNHGGFLPEPRDEQENQFLYDLSTKTFTLGMTDRDVEGQWVWSSDGSSVAWLPWDVSKTVTSAAEPNGGSSAGCAIMMRSYALSSWADYPCASTAYFNTQPRSLICQRNTRTGM